MSGSGVQDLHNTDEELGTSWWDAEARTIILKRYGKAQEKACS